MTERDPMGPMASNRTKREARCPNCGAGLGHYGRPDPYETCGAVECEREAQHQYRADTDNAMYDAMEDGYDRYR